MSNTYVSRETDTAFVIKCKTCSGMNIFPKEKDESRGKYEAFLSQKAKLNEARDFIDSRPLYSFSSKGSKT
jgi:hypothetical protein